MAVTYKNLLKQNHEGKELTINHIAWTSSGMYAKATNQYDCYLDKKHIPKSVADELLGTYQHRQISHNSIYGSSHTVYELLRKTY